MTSSVSALVSLIVTWVMILGGVFIGVVGARKLMNERKHQDSYKDFY